MTKFQNKYRIETTRLHDWDYGSNGYYFITICTKNKLYYFGEIIDEKMNLSEIGKLAEKYWYEIPQHFPFVKLGAFIVMPNHVHGIIIIDKPDDERIDNIDNNVETQNSPWRIASLQQPQNKFGPQSQNLASIIRGYKTTVTINARKINPDFAWQSRFYEHVIRNEKSLNKIENYIINNSLKWLYDEYNTESRKKS